MAQDNSAPNIFHPTLFNPFLQWADMAMKTTEMMVSSGQVIGERVDEIARAGANASPRDFKELTQVGGDKVSAATETGVEAMTRMQMASYELLTRGWQQWFASVGAITSLFGSRTFGEALSRQDRLFDSLGKASPANQLAQQVTDAAPKRQSAHARRPARVSRSRTAASKR